MENNTYPALVYPALVRTAVRYLREEPDAPATDVYDHVVETHDLDTEDPDVAAWASEAALEALTHF